MSQILWNMNKGNITRPKYEKPPSAHGEDIVKLFPTSVQPYNHKRGIGAQESLC